MIQLPDDSTLGVNINASVSSSVKDGLIRPSGAAIINDREALLNLDGSASRLDSLKGAGAATAQRIGAGVGRSAIASIKGNNNDNSPSDQILSGIDTGGKYSTRLAQRTWRSAKNARNAAKLARQAQNAAGTARRTASGIKKTANTFRAVVDAFKATYAALTSPAIGVAALIVVLIAVIVIAVGSIASIIPSITLKSDDVELTKTYSYITELDLNLTQKLRGYIDDPDLKDVDEFRYIIGSSEVAWKDVNIKTDADLFLIFLDSKYDDYTLDGILLFFGVKVRDEITKIHEQLYTVNLHRKEVAVNPSPDPEDPEDPENPSPDPPPKPRPPVELLSTSFDKAQSAAPSGQSQNTKTVLEIRVTATAFDKYIDHNKADLMNDAQFQRFEALKNISEYTFREELGSPFVGQSWKGSVTSRFGWRIHPITGESNNHQGIDIAMPHNTPIHAVISGTVSSVRYDESYGKVIEIKSINGDKSVLYAHCSTISARKGQEVSKGDIVAYVGNTGDSTGVHLHIEYTKDGHRLNPGFYLKE